MASLPVRDPVGDHLLTPQNSALVVIDYQPSQFAGVRSIDRDLLLENIVSTVETAKAFDMLIVHSTIDVATGRGQPTVPGLAELLEDNPPIDQDNPPIDRTTTNAWEDAEFLAVVRATGRRKLILCALWTEICMAFPALDALREGFDVYPVVDAIGGTSEEAHRAGIERVVLSSAAVTSLPTGKADCRRTASRFSRCSVLTEDLPSVGLVWQRSGCSVSTISMRSATVSSRAQSRWSSTARATQVSGCAPATDRLGDSVDDHTDESGWLSRSLEKVAYQSQQMPVASKSSPVAHARQPTPSRDKY